MSTQNYPGIYKDEAGGLTPMGRTVMDAWVFEIIPTSETCEGWDLSRMDALARQVADKWAEFDNSPRNLPDDYRMRHAMLYEQARMRGEGVEWDPTIDGDD
ncbi:MAG TPA: hypothetical protein VFS17_08350 [Methylophilaceae bacterium]|nr:hypothetical protein [Methylophilaceae bacterium]